MHDSNLLNVVGPHAGLELSYHLADTGLSLTGRIDLGTNLGLAHQKFTTTSINPIDPTLPTLPGETIDHFWRDAPTLNVQLGLDWHPPTSLDCRLFLGYQYEYWWNVGKDVTFGTGARANLWDSAVVMQATFRF
jgi:hypothetical protein